MFDEKIVSIVFFMFICCHAIVLSQVYTLWTKSYQFFNHEEVERISDYYEYPTIIDIICSKSGGRKDMDKGSRDRVFVWSYLKRMVMSDNEYFKDIFTATLRLFVLLQMMSYVCRACL